MAHYVTAIDIANKFRISRQTVVKRFEKLDIQPLNLNQKLYYLNSNVDLLHTMKNPRNFITPNERFAIVEYFLTHRDNRAMDIEKVFFIPQHRIDRILSEYLKNDLCITVPSKMNKE